MEIVNKNGRTYFVPAKDVSDNSGITNFSCWEQALCVYSNIYCKKHLERSTELIQYNHSIHTAALTYTWENVYLYDRDFRHHLSRYPNHSWAIILQQSWTMRLKDKNKGFSNNHNRTLGSKHKFRNDVCWEFNSGHCSYGSACIFEHRCGICNKFGHVVTNLLGIKNLRKDLLKVVTGILMAIRITIPSPQNRNKGMGRNTITSRIGIIVNSNFSCRA